MAEPTTDLRETVPEKYAAAARAAAGANATDAGVTNVKFIRGHIEQIPSPTTPSTASCPTAS